jgi:signal transduction histidine kinase/ActR/RegA family two-component response regulator
MKLRSQVSLFLFAFGLVPLLAAVVINVPLVFGSLELVYHRTYLQSLRLELRDLDQHLASRNETARLLAKLPEPGAFREQAKGSQTAPLDTTRARYVDWLNDFLRDQLDIVQILFLDGSGRVRFWLERDKDTLSLRPGRGEPDRPAQAFFEAGMRLRPGGFLISPISINPRAANGDWRRFMMLRVISPIIGYPPASGSEESEGRAVGAVVINIDVGGVARVFRNTYWVHDDGRYLQHAGANIEGSNAFQDFPGLKELFRKGNFALWKNGDDQIIWAPLFVTEQSGPLWVGRRVDFSPMAEFRQAVQTRILTIIVVLIILVFLAARWVAVRIERFGQELTHNIGRVLQGDEAVRFSWRGPPELQALAGNLSQLAETHAHNARELRDHAKALEESNRYKSEFLANVSHELRTPLNSILVLSKLLRDSAEQTRFPDQAKQAQVIHGAANDLAALIDNVLDLSRIEARQTVFRVGAIALPNLLTELAELVRPQFEVKGLALAVEIDDSAVHTITSDREKLRQILKNFLSNAVKFTASGRITLALSRNTLEDQVERPVSISVHDTGIGIPQEKHKTIFEAFKQADGSTRRLYGGTGLGLSISRELATLMGGRIVLVSQPGQGSTFSLLLPLEFVPEPGTAYQARGEAAPSGAEAEEVPEADFSSYSVLLVDDEVQNLLRLTPMLEHWGIRVVAAGDGNEAWETLAEEDGFDLVLMDVMMPEMDGFSTLARIRAEQRFRHLPIVVLVDVDDQVEPQACIAKGANDVISKPIRPSALKAVLARYLEPSAVSEETK